MEPLVLKNTSHGTMEPDMAMPPPKGIMAIITTSNSSIQQPQTGQAGLTPPRVPNQKPHQLRQTPGGLVNTEVVPREEVDSTAGVRPLSFSKKPLSQPAVRVVVPRMQRRESQSGRHGRPVTGDREDGQEELSQLDSAVETGVPPGPAKFNPVLLLEEKLGQSREKDREARDEVEQTLSKVDALTAVVTLVRAMKDLKNRPAGNEIPAAEQIRSGKVENSLSQITSSTVQNRMDEIKNEFMKALEGAEVADASFEPLRGIERALRLVVGGDKSGTIEHKLLVACVARVLYRIAPDCFPEIVNAIGSQLVGYVLSKSSLRKYPVRNRGGYSNAISDGVCFVQLRSTMSVAWRLLVGLTALIERVSKDEKCKSR